MKKFVSLILALVLVLSMATCAFAEDAKKVMFINPIRALDYFVNIEAMVLKECAERGYEVNCVDSNADYSVAADYVSQAIASKYDAIMFCGDESLIPSANEAAEAGIPIVNFDSWIGGGELATRISSDNVAMGRQMGEYAVELLKERYDGEVKGTVLYMNFSISSMLDRCEGFVSAFEGYDDVTLVEVITKDQFIDEAYITMENTLTAMPAGTIDIIFGSNSGVALGALSAAETAERSDFCVIGIDDEEGQISALRDVDSTYTATLAQDPVSIGRICVESLEKIFAGEPVEEIVSVDARLVTKDNVEEFLANEEVTKTELEAHK